MRSKPLLLLVFCLVVSLCAVSALTTVSSAGRAPDHAADIPASQERDAPSPKPGDFTKQDLDRLFKRRESLQLSSADAAGRVRRGEGLTLKTAGLSFDLELTAHDMRSADYRAEEVGPDGALRPVPAGEVRTYKGKVRGRDDAQARFTIDEDHVEGVIFTPKERYYVEPLRKYSKAAAETDFIIYKESDINSAEAGTCPVGLSDELDRTAGTLQNRVEQSLSDDATASAAATYREITMSTDADYEYYQALGSSQAVNAEILGVMNQVEGIYETQLGVSFKINYQLNWTSPTAPGYPYFYNYAEGLLDAFVQYWNNNVTVARDVAHMWTGKPLVGTAIGVAKTGTICSSPSQAYGMTMRQTSPDRAKTYIVTAHELGHNLGAPHTEEMGYFGCENSIMNTAVSPSTQPSFCLPSIQHDLLPYVNANSACMTDTLIQPDYTVSVTAVNPAVGVGSAGTGSAALYNVAISYKRGFQGALSLSTTGLPDGSVVTFNQPTIPVTQSTSYSTQMKIQAGLYTQPGAFNFQVVAANGSVTRSAAASVTLDPALTMSATSIEPKAVVGGDAIYRVDVDRSGFFTGPLTYSVTGLPAGATAGFFVWDTATEQNSVVIKTSQTTPRGAYPLTVVASSSDGKLQATAGVTLTVVDFSISVAEPVVTVESGQDAVFNVKVSSLDDLSGLPPYLSGLSQGYDLLSLKANEEAFNDGVHTYVTHYVRSVDDDADTCGLVYTFSPSYLSATTTAVTLTVKPTRPGVYPLTVLTNKYGRQATTTLVVHSKAYVPTAYSVIDLGVPAGSTTSFARSINNQGQIVGTPAFIYENGVMTKLTPPEANASPVAINDSGQIIAQGANGNPHLFSGGAWTTLNFVGSVYGINNSGQIVGHDLTGAFIYSGGVKNYIGNFQPQAINNSGQVTGWFYPYPGVYTYHALLYSGGTLTDLGSAGATMGDNQYASSKGYALNDAGQVAGETEIVVNNRRQTRGGFYSNGAWTVLNGLSATAINTSGQVVGGQSINTYLHSGGVFSNLLSLIPASASWVYLSPYDINDAGSIVGSGTGPDCKSHAFLMGQLPTHTISGRVTDAGNVGVGGVVVILSGGQRRTTITDPSGNYKFEFVPEGGSYKVTPWKLDTDFNQQNQKIINLKADATANFGGAASSCSFSITPASKSLAGAATTGNVVSVTANSGTCPWTAASNSAWITITSGQSGTGSQPVTYSVAANPGLTPRTGTLTVAGSTHTVTQAAAIYVISGKVLLGTAGLGVVKLTLSSPSPAGFTPRTVTTNTLGEFKFTGVPGGRNYTLTPTKTGYFFKNTSATSQSSRAYTNLKADQSNQNFAATAWPKVSVNDLKVVEGNTTTVNATFTVKLSAPSSQTVTVKYATANGTALSTSDYTARALTTLTFTPGQTTKTVAVTVKGDTVQEPNENFYLKLSAATNATILDNSGTCTINDNDQKLTITDVTLTEGNAGTTSAVFTVKLSAASANVVTVKYATANGTALSTSDYTARALTTLTFTPGQTTKTVAVTVKGDTLKEPDETFFVNLSGAVNATILDAQGKCTILNGTDVALLSDPLSDEQSAARLARALGLPGLYLLLS